MTVMLRKTGPHIQHVTPAGLAWAAKARVVKALDDPTPLRRAPAGAIRIFRRYFPQQDMGRHGADIARDVLAALGDAPADYLELYNETAQRLGQGLERHVSLTREAVAHVRASRPGLKVCGYSFSTGSPEPADWAYLRAQGWGGADAIGRHAYWGLPPNGANPAAPFTPWNALRHRTDWRPGDVPILLTEIGRDKVRDGAGGVYVGAGGWIADGVSAEQYIAELAAYDAMIGQDAYVLGATPFTSGAAPDWSAYQIDGITDRLIALTQPPVAPPAPIPGGGTVEFPFNTTLYASPNVSGPDTTRSLVVIHSTRSGRVKTNTGQPWTMEHEFDTTTGYMLQSGTVSSDAVVSPARVGLMQPFGAPGVTWHAGYNNTKSRGYEICQARIDTPYVDAQLCKTAFLVRQDCLRHGIPMKRVMDETQAGIIGHEDSAQGKAGGKSDPGPLFNWATFIKYVNDANLFAPAPAEQYEILGFRAWLDAQPPGEYGAPRHDAREFGDGSGDLYVRLMPTAAHADGPYLLFRSYIYNQTGDLMRAIRPVSWS